MIFTRIPLFPNFAPISFDHIAEYSQFIAGFPPHGDFTINSLINWLNLDQHLKICHLNGNIVLSYDLAFEEHSSKLTILGTQRPVESVQVLFNYQRQTGHTPQLSLVPDYFVKALGHKHSLSVTLDEANTDYVYDSHQVLGMDGPGMRGFRREVNYFLKNFSETAKMYAANLDSLSTRIRLINELHTWDKVYRFGNDTERQEGLSINSALVNQYITPYHALVLETDDEISGFGIFQYPPNENWAVFNYIKCNYEKRALFDFLFYGCTSYMQTQGKRWINFEQDLGIEGLRYHKERISPVRRLQKYTVEPLD